MRYINKLLNFIFLFYITVFCTEDLRAYENEFLRSRVDVFNFFSNSDSSINEECYEWLDLLESIQNSKEKFVFVEVGAGEGRWGGHAALSSRSINKAFQLYFVEAEPTRCYEKIPALMSQLNVTADQYKVFDFAIGNSENYTFFYTHNNELNLTNWFGQCIMMDHDSIVEWMSSNLYGHPIVKMKSGYHAVAVNQKKLSSLLSAINEPIIDLCDFDIQGMEFIAIEEAIDIINQRVKRLHIGTHSHEIEKDLISLLKKNGWKLIVAYPCLGVSDTEFGKVKFTDGIQSWINPRLNQM